MEQPVHWGRLNIGHSANVTINNCPKTVSESLCHVSSIGREG